MSYLSHLRGIASGIEYSADVPMNLDPSDGRPVEMVLDLERLRAEQPDHRWYTPQRPDMWRFGALLLHFGTAGKVRAASLEDLQRAPGVSRSDEHTSELQSL